MEINKNLLRKTSLNLKLSRTLENMYDNYYDNRMFNKYMRRALNLIKNGANINTTNSNKENLALIVAQKFADINLIEPSFLYSFEQKYKQSKRCGETLMYLICKGTNLGAIDESGVSVEGFIRQATPSVHKLGLLNLIERRKSVDIKIEGSKNKDANK